MPATLTVRLRTISVGSLMERDVWLSLLPRPFGEEEERLFKLFEKKRADELSSDLLSPPLPAELVLPCLARRPTMLLAFGGPRSAEDLIGAVIWNPDARPWPILWINFDSVASQLEEFAKPYMDELLVLDRPDVRAEHREWCRRNDIT